MKTLLAILSVLFLAIVPPTLQLGINTHAFVGIEAMQKFSRKHTPFKKLISHNYDAFISGFVYPDADSMPLCMAAGVNLHTTEFLEKYAIYIKSKCHLTTVEELRKLSPKCQRLIAHFYGFAGHLAADNKFHKDFLPLILANEPLLPQNKEIAHRLAEYLLDQYLILKIGYSPVAEAEWVDPISKGLLKLPVAGVQSVPACARSLYGMEKFLSQKTIKIWPLLGCESEDDDGGYLAEEEAAPAVPTNVLPTAVTPEAIKSMDPTLVPENIAALGKVAGPEDFTKVLLDIKTKIGEMADKLDDKEQQKLLEEYAKNTISALTLGENRQCPIEIILKWTLENIFLPKYPGAIPDDVKEVVKIWKLATGFLFGQLKTMRTM